MVSLAGALLRHGAELFSTGGTFDALRAASIPVRDVSEITGWPAMLGGRVKTLHPAVHGALLADPTDPAHAADMREHGIRPFDMVVCNLYPFAKARADLHPSPSALLLTVAALMPLILFLDVACRTAAATCDEWRTLRPCTAICVRPSS